MSCKCPRFCVCLVVLAVLLSASLFYGAPLIKSSFDAIAFADKYPYKWASSDQPEVINYGSKWQKNKIKLSYADGFVKIMGISSFDALPALLKGLFADAGFLKPVVIGENAFGLGVSFDRGESVDETVKLVKDTGVRSVIVRVADSVSDVYAKADRENTHRGIKALIANNVEVVVSMPQSRQTTSSPELWTAFVKETLATYYPESKYFIVGHAPNRVKWGVWDYREFLRLYFLAESEIRKHKDARIIGPSVIDFEWFWFDALLSYMRHEDADVLNMLLYVDRRGAPENKQYGFDLAGKLKVIENIISGWRGTAGKKTPFWITETNWPLKDTGDFAPAGGGVDEETYADYLVRYYVIGLSSGVPERIYWWRLTARGYGLVDDSSGILRKRPGYEAFKNLRQALEGAEFMAEESTGKRKVFLFKKNSSYFRIAWATEPADYAPSQGARVFDRSGVERKNSGTLRLSGSPVYIYDIVKK